METFFMGTHEAHWLSRVTFPLFVSRRRLLRQKRWRPACCSWALDSGAYTELKDHGGWTITPYRYVDEVRRWRDMIGGMQWAAPMDWMCEEEILEKTRLTIREHQLRTWDNYHHLHQLAPEIPWTPVLQGWSIDDYLWHLDHYRASVRDWGTLPVVGVGSICRRQGSQEIAEILHALHVRGVPCHGFGLKTEGLLLSHTFVTSADSLAWSYAGRKGKAPWCKRAHVNCANCFEYACRWRTDLMQKLGRVECCQGFLTS